MDQEKVRVVVVDDVADAAETLAALLTSDGYEVATAQSAAAAVQLIEERKPHCVILDIGMPGIDGYDLATCLRHRYGNDILLIAVTGWTESDSRVAETFAVVDHHFRKPVEPELLRHLLPALREARGSSPSPRL